MQVWIYKMKRPMPSKTAATILPAIGFSAFDSGVGLVDGGVFSTLAVGFALGEKGHSK